MPGYAYFILAAGWLFWFLPFPLTRWNRSAPQTRDNRARWGIVLHVVSYVLLWQSRFWTMYPAAWRVALSAIFLALAVVLSWTSTHALGKHLRFDAALSPDHELVQWGAYSVLRHPIYSSMFCLLLGTGFMVSPAILFISAIVIFILGTEIRVRIEDNLLRSRFGEQFRRYQQSVPAYIPLIR